MGTEPAGRVLAYQTLVVNLVLRSDSDLRLNERQRLAHARPATSHGDHLAWTIEFITTEKSNPWMTAETITSFRSLGTMATTCHSCIKAG